MGFEACNVYDLERGGPGGAGAGACGFKGPRARVLAPFWFCVAAIFVTLVD